MAVVWTGRRICELISGMTSQQRYLCRGKLLCDVVRYVQFVGQIMLCLFVWYVILSSVVIWARFLSLWHFQSTRTNCVILEKRTSQSRFNNIYAINEPWDFTAELIAFFHKIGICHNLYTWQESCRFQFNNNIYLFNNNPKQTLIQ